MGSRSSSSAGSPARARPRYAAADSKPPRSQVVAESSTAPARVG